jgi:hypothetical protein
MVTMVRFEIRGEDSAKAPPLFSQGLPVACVKSPRPGLVLLVFVPGHPVSVQFECVRPNPFPIRDVVRHRANGRERMAPPCPVGSSGPQHALPGDTCPPHHFVYPTAAPKGHITAGNSWDSPGLTAPGSGVLPLSSRARALSSGTDSPFRASRTSRITRSCAGPTRSPHRTATGQVETPGANSTSGTYSRHCGR